MTKDHQDVWQWLQQLAARSMADQMRAAQRYAELAQRAGRGELLKPAVAQEYLRFVQQETAQYARSLAMLSLNYYNAAVELERSYNDRFFEQVLGLGAAGGAKAPAAPSRAAGGRRRVEIELRAPLGAEARQTFVLENKHSEPAEISFLVSDFAGPGDSPPFRPALDFEPPRFTLGPREEQAVTLRLALAPELFAAGQRYTATAVVGGYDDLELGLNVAVDAPAESPEPSESAQS